MDDLLTAFININYSPELKGEIYKTLTLCEKFDCPDVYSPLLDIVTDNSQFDNSSMVDQFIQAIHGKLDFILEEHQIRLIDGASIEEKNQIVSALLLLMDLYDYTGVLSILENMEEPYTQFSDILADLCELDITRILTLVEYIDINILQILKKYAYAKEDSKKIQEESDPEIIKYLKIFKNELGESNFGIQLAVAGFRLGEPLETYLEFLDAEVSWKGTPEFIALNLLSLIYLSEDGYKNPLNVYREYSFRVLKDLNAVSQIEVILIQFNKKIIEAMDHSKVQKTMTGV